jgi:FkbM family methyltransferase
MGEGADMMMDWDHLVSKYSLARHVTGVLHCGAHLAEEAPDYDRAFGPDVPVWWVEGNPAVFAKITGTLVSYPNQHLVCALLADIDWGEREFHVTNYDGMSSSLLRFGTHPTFSPDTVFVNHLVLPTRTVDSLVAEHGIAANMLVMDLQGAEGLCLAGAKDLLPSLDFVMSEVNKVEVYEGCVMVDELDRVLKDFDRVETLWVSDFGWGDGLWIRQ